MLSRESRAVDMESLCIVAGKYVWSVRVDLHILDNGGYVLYTNTVIDAWTLLVTLSKTNLFPFFVPQESH